MFADWLMSHAKKQISKIQHIMSLLTSHKCVFDWKLERLFSALAFPRRGKFGTTFVIEDHLGYGASKEPMNVSWQSIDRFL